ncbi:MAG TPA: dienelactone hydrolase [Planctomycetota bacterium]
MLFIVAGAFGADAPVYDPLALPAGIDIQPQDFTVADKARERELPIRVFLPVEMTPAIVILFSHGLGGTCKGSAFLGKHWAARGYAVVYVQHPGSDDSVWKDQPMLQRMGAMRQAASAKNFMFRVKDIPAVLDQLTIWNQEEKHPLFGRLDLSKVGMSGHSFGAVTTQAVSGQRFMGGMSFTDPRIKAALPMSPSTPKGGDAATAFGSVKIPWMLMTGTKDTSPINDTDVASRLAVYPALTGEKYELVLDEAEHSVFTDRALPGEKGKRNPNHHRVILALSTAFWDAQLRGNEAARAWLQGAGPRTVLEEKDKWQFKAQ